MEPDRKLLFDLDEKPSLTLIKNVTSLDDEDESSSQTVSTENTAWFVNNIDKFNQRAYNAFFCRGIFWYSDLVSQPGIFSRPFLPLSARRSILNQRILRLPSHYRCLHYPSDDIERGSIMKTLQLIESRFMNSGVSMKTEHFMFLFRTLTTTLPTRNGFSFARIYSDMRSLAKNPDNNMLLAFPGDSPFFSPPKAKKTTFSGPFKAAISHDRSVIALKDQHLFLFDTIHKTVIEGTFDASHLNHFDSQILVSSDDGDFSLLTKTGLTRIFQAPVSVSKVKASSGAVPTFGSVSRQRDQYLFGSLHHFSIYESSSRIHDFAVMNERSYLITDDEFLVMKAGIVERKQKLSLAPHSVEANQLLNLGLFMFDEGISLTDLRSNVIYPLTPLPIRAKTCEFSPFLDLVMFSTEDGYACIDLRYPNQLAMRLTLPGEPSVKTQCKWMPNSRYLVCAGPDSIMLLSPHLHSNPIFASYPYLADDGLISIDPCSDSFFVHHQNSLNFYHIM